MVAAILCLFWFRPLAVCHSLRSRPHSEGAGLGAVRRTETDAQATHMINATEELDRIRQRRALTARKPYRASRLERHRAELVELRRAGASYPELADWLRREKRTKVCHTTVLRYLKSLPEMGSDNA